MSEFGRRDSSDDGSGRSARRDEGSRGRSDAPRGDRRGARQDRGGRDSHQGRPRRDDRGVRGGGKPFRSGDGPRDRDQRGGYAGQGRDSGRNFGDRDDRRGGYGNRDSGGRPGGGSRYSDGGSRNDERGGSRSGGRFEDRGGNRSGGRYESSDSRSGRSYDDRGGRPGGGRPQGKSSYCDRKPRWEDRGGSGRRDDDRGRGGYQRRDDDRGARPGGFRSDDRGRGGSDSRGDRGGYQRRDDDRGARSGGFRSDDRGGSDRGGYQRRDDDRGARTGGFRSDDRGGRDDRGDRSSYQRRDNDRGTDSRDSRDSRDNRNERAGGGYQRRDDRDRKDRRDERPRREPRPKVGAPLDDEALAKELLEAPELPEDIEFSDLDEDARRELRTLPKGLAETVGKHLVAAGGLIDSDPEAALEHAKYAKAKASRVPIVREALGLVAYHAGNWSEALSELRAVRRMTRTDDHIAIIADAERALGRPERALDLAKEVDTAKLAKATQVELAIVAAGARRDLGQIDAAVVSLQGDDLKPAKRDPWSARLFYAYADHLVAAGRKEEAIRWFLNAAEADAEDETDAAERAADLSNENAEEKGTEATDE